MNKQIKEKWTHEDFDTMGWHDSSLYAIHFPSDPLFLTLDIDYIFRWEKRSPNQFQFWVAPCLLSFSEVLYLKLTFDFGNVVGAEIDTITREPLGYAPNGITKLWKYTIQTSSGLLNFESTGFVQTLQQPPVLSNTQSLGRSKTL
ncbi:MAG: hypothetical protein ACFB0B_14875 [Thermonemataceae bacterium]